MNQYADIIISRNISNLVRNNQLEDACKILYATLANHPHPERVQFHIARLKFRSKDFEGALALFEKIESHFQNSYKYWYLRGKCAYVFSNYEIARNCFQHAQAIHSLPQKAVAHFAVQAYKTGHFELAARQFESIEEYIEKHYYLKKYSMFSKALITNDGSELDKPNKWTEHIIVHGIVECREKNLPETANFLLKFFLAAPVQAFERSYFLEIKKQKLKKKALALNEYLMSPHIEDIDYTSHPYRT